MNNKKIIGNLGEELASKFLERRKYLILERNYRCRFGEIDIIAMQNKKIIFCEVKTRTNYKCGTGLSSINNKKQMNIFKTAQFYISYKNLRNYETRIDAIEIFLQKGKCIIKHYYNIIC